MNKSLMVLGVLASLLLLAACRPDPSANPPVHPSEQRTAAANPLPSEPGDVAALVNGQVIPMALFQAQAEAAVRAFRQQPGNAQEAPEAQPAEQALRRQVLDLLIDQVLIEQAAAREQVAVDQGQVDAEVARVRAENPDGFSGWLAANGFTEESFRAQVHRDLLATALRQRIADAVAGQEEQVHLRQIVVATEAEAQELLAQVAAGTAAFEELARAHSLDEAGRAVGGDLGFVPRGVLSPAVEEAAFGLQPGQVAGPVESATGWHLVLLVARDPAREVPPELLAARQQESFARWLAEERERAEIERYVP